MLKVIFPATCMLMVVGALAGPNDPITASIFAKAMLTGVSSYIGCCLTDWLYERYSTPGQ